MKFFVVYFSFWKSRPVSNHLFWAFCSRQPKWNERTMGKNHKNRSFILFFFARERKTNHDERFICKYFAIRILNEIITRHYRLLFLLLHGFLEKRKFLLTRMNWWEMVQVQQKTSLQFALFAMYLLLLFISIFFCQSEKTRLISNNQNDKCFDYLLIIHKNFMMNVDIVQIFRRYTNELLFELLLKVKCGLLSLLVSRGFQAFMKRNVVC